MAIARGCAAWGCAMAQSSGVIIRPATPQDAEALALLAHLVFRHTYGAAIPTAILDDYLARVFSPAVFQAVVGDSALCLLVAEQTNHLIGYSKCAGTTPAFSVTPGRVIELVNLYVHPAHQGRGIGTTLLQQSLQHAMDEKFAAMWLCVWQENRAALNFYQRAGFTQVGQTQVFVDSIVFEDWVLEKVVETQI